MSTIIRFELKELRKLSNDPNSCVVEKKVTQNLPLQPWSLGNLKEAIKSLLDYRIGKFDKEFNGILLSYKNLRILQNIGAIRNDSSDINFLVQADYFIFQPVVGARMTGIVNIKSTTHLGILIHRVFNVVIPRPTEEPGNKWLGESIKEGQEVFFRIVVLDLYGALPYIRGELDDRSITLGPDGDEAEARTLNVSYVNFDKTKPQYLTQTEDELPQNSKKKTQCLSKDQQKKHGSLLLQSLPNGKSKSTAKNDDSNSSIIKKKQARNLDNDLKKSDTSPKSSKKFRKDSIEHY